LFYRREGKPELPVLFFSHSIGCDHGMWARQASALQDDFQIVRYDTRGHGASDAPPRDYSVERLGRDALGLADALGISQFAFCGLSLGGATGQWIARHAPQRLSRLIIANSSPQFGPRASWEARIKAVQEGGMAAIADVVMPRFFSAATLARGDADAESIRSVLRGTNPVGYLGCCAALRDFDSLPWLKEISVPTLVIAGNRDIATPWTGHGEILAREIPGARSLRLDAAHLANLERPHSFTAAVLEFLRPAGAFTDPLEAGFKARRSVLGEAHVDQAIASTTDFNREFQELITRYAWGTIWTRPELDRHTRRLLVLATMAALGRWEEFRLHVRTGLQNELELCDLKEVLLQTAIYAGVPAANTGFHVVTEEMEKARSN
jgi:3-oxoadipate enol-lactonase/4-carboxymuconolactone decarboxylase